MSDHIIFAAEEKFGLANNQKITFLNSQYLEHYNKVRLEIKNKNQWKTSGEGAKFMGIYNRLEHFDPSKTMAVINGITSYHDHKIIYTIHINEVSGIFIKNPLNDKEYEGHILHKDHVIFNNIDFNSENSKLVVSVCEDCVKSHLAILDVEDSNYHFITEGDCIDNNPTWSKTNPQVIYYDTAGIAQDPSTMQMKTAPTYICKLDTGSGTIEEIIFDEAYNYIKPKEDKEGNLYFIRTPYKEKKEQKISLLDILLIPVRILKAIFGWLNIFSMVYGGKPLTSTGGPNPARQKEQNPKDIFIEGNLINAEKTLEENKRSGEKYPGIAPRSWELMKMEPGQAPVTLKKGVIDYDINDQDEIIYSNGTYIVKLSADQKEEVVGKAELISKVKFI